MVPATGLTTPAAIYRSGGNPLLVEALQADLGLQIDQVVQIGFAGYVKVTDRLGGVDMPSDRGTPRSAARSPRLALSRSSGAAHGPRSPSVAAGRTISVANSVTTSTSICSSSVGVRSKTPFGLATAGTRRSARRKFNGRSKRPPARWGAATSTPPARPVERALALDAANVEARRLAGEIKGNEQRAAAGREAHRLAAEAEQRLSAGEWDAAARLIGQARGLDAASEAVAAAALRLGGLRQAAA